MRRRQPLPDIWLFTDERQGDALLPALARLPRGGGVILRHYSLPGGERLALARRLRALTRRRGQLLLVGGDARLARAAGADGVHIGRAAPPVRGLITAAARDAAGLVRARRLGAALVFLSPAFATASHPGARPLGPVRFGLLARLSRVSVAALGGMTPARARRLPHAAAWGAVDAFTLAVRPTGKPAATAAHPTNPAPIG